MNKSCVVNFANGAWYPRGQQRLYQTIMQHTDRSYPFDFLDINNYDDIQCPRHDQLPYAFKYKSVAKAASMGYVNILWLDCSMYAIKAIDPIFRHLDEHGYAVTWSPFNNAQWTNDRMLEYFGYTRDEAETTRHLYSGCWGINKHYPKFLEFYEMFEKSVPFFKGSWENSKNTESNDPRCCGHRHDQSALSLIFNKLGMLDETGQFFEYKNSNNIYKEKTCLIADGM